MIQTIKTEFRTSQVALLALPNRLLPLQVNFLTYAATYTLPSVLPFVASAFPEIWLHLRSLKHFGHNSKFWHSSTSQGKSQQCHLLLNMMIFQSIGDVSGRMLAPTAKYLAFYILLRCRLLRIVMMCFDDLTVSWRKRIHDGYFVLCNL